MLNHLKMGDTLPEYIERLELLAFFAGYPLVYSIMHFIAGAWGRPTGPFWNRTIKLLPDAYALTGTLFLGLVLKDIKAGAALRPTDLSFHISFLQIWGIGAVLFWIPLLAKKPVYSLAHSLVLFSLLLKDILTGLGSVSGRDIVKNDMKIYAVSFLLNLISLGIIIIFYFFLAQISARKK